MTFNISSLVELILTLLSIVLTYFASAHLKSKSAEHIVNVARSLTADATNAVEQMSKNTVMTSQQKKDVAMTAANSALSDLGIKIPSDTVDTLIESAVSAFNINKPSKLSTVIQNAVNTTSTVTAQSQTVNQVASTDNK